MSYTLLIIGICLATYILELIWGQFVYYIAFNPAYALNMPWQFITSLFAHGSFMHLFINMYVLFFFGTKLENWVGSSNFLKVFFISGVVGNIAHLVYSSFLGYPVISMGASGAVCGILGALTILEPDMKIMLFPIPIPINLSTAMVLFVIFEIACILFSILPTIGHDAHLGGLFAGLLIGKMLEKKYKNQYYIYSS